MVNRIENDKGERGGFSRRTFLVTSVAAGGGLMLGVYLPRSIRAAAQGTVESFAPNAFVRIRPDDSITLIMPQVEMGQGTYTSMSMLIAEELEVALEQVGVEAAPPNDKLYANPLLGFQVTGGSTSVPGFWEPLRRAGATARVMLIEAAAAQWNVDAASCRAENGEVVSPTGERLKYGALVEAASKLPVPDRVALKAPEEFTLIGTPAKRLDTPEKVNGKAKFGIDAVVPGMKFATVAACPVFGGKLKSVDDSETLAIAGVRQVVRIDNAVAVVGDHMWAAMQGLQALDIEWDDGPNAHVTTASIVAQMARASENNGVVARADGDFAKAIPTAARRIEAIYEMPFLAHAAMEPMNCTVHVTKDSCDIWVGIQVVARAQATAAQVTGLPPEKIQVHNHLIGGGFGRRLDVDGITQAVAIAKQVDGPVKIDLESRRGHPARRLPTLLLRPIRSRSRCSQQADRLPSPGHGILDPGALGTACVRKRARRRCRRRRGEANAIRDPEHPRGLCSGRASGPYYRLVARRRPHAQYLRGGELHR